MINNNKDTNSKEVLRKVWRYEEMLRSNTKVYFDEDDLLDIAEYYYYDMSKDAEALRCLDYALKLHPESLPVKLRISEIRYFQGETAEAWELLKSVSEQDDPDVLYFHGLFSLEEKDYRKAEEYYRKAYSQEQGTGVDLFCSIVTDYLEHGVIDVLDKWFNMLPDVYQSEPKVLDLKVSYLQMSGRPAEAVKLVEKLIDSEPYNVEHWINLTKLYMQLGEFGKARESNAYIQDLDPGNHVSLCFSADIEFHTGNMRLAHDLYDKYISVEDKDAYAYFNNAFCLVYMYKLDEAMQQLHYSKKFVDDSNTELQKKIYLLTASVLICKDKLDEAKEELEKARECGLPDEDYQHNSAMILFKGGKAAEAVRILDALLLKYLKEGTFPEPVYNAYLVLGDYDDLIKALDTTVAFCSSTDTCQNFDTECSPFYAFCYYEKKEKVKFLNYLKTAVEKSPGVVARLFESVFPESLDVKDYYTYAERGMLNSKIK